MNYVLLLYLITRVYIYIYILYDTVISLSTLILYSTTSWLCNLPIPSLVHGQQNLCSAKFIIPIFSKSFQDLFREYFVNLYFSNFTCFLRRNSKMCLLILNVFFLKTHKSIKFWLSYWIKCIFMFLVGCRILVPLKDMNLLLMKENESEY